MKDNEIKKIVFWKKLKMSILNIENYSTFAMEKPSNVLNYFIKLMIACSVLIAIGLTYKFSQVYITTTDILKNEVPDFECTNGTLTVHGEDVTRAEDKNLILSKIIVDDTENIEKQEEYKKEMRTQPAATFFSKNGVFINLPNKEELIYFDYQEVMERFGIEQLTKQQIIDYINGVNVVLLYGVIALINVIYIFFIYSIFTALDIILLSILGFFTSRVMKMKLKYMPIVNIVTHALTLSVILSSIYMIINVLTGLEIRYFQWMYNLITYIYMVIAILMIREEMIQQQIKLAKLAEEQKKIKEELEQSQKEEKKKDKEKNKEDDNVTGGSNLV